MLQCILFYFGSRRIGVVLLFRNGPGDECSSGTWGALRYDNFGWLVPTFIIEGPIKRQKAGHFCGRLLMIRNCILGD